MKLPNGQFLPNINTPITLALWAEHLEKSQAQHLNVPSIIIACVGEPSYPVPTSVTQAGVRFWQNAHEKSVQAEQLMITSTHYDDALINTAAYLRYADDPTGDEEPRKKLAAYYSQRYQISITENQLLFTVGATSGLNGIFTMLQHVSPGRIVTPRPFYWTYQGSNQENHLHFIDVMQAPGYRLNAKVLQDSIHQAQQLAVQDKKNIGAFLFCDPNNPLGTVVGFDEWVKIAEVLKTVPNVPIILDESYDDLQLTGQYRSLLEAASELKERMIIVHSGTKTLSSAGERLACLIFFNHNWLTTTQFILVNQYIHAPRSSQRIYADGIIARTDQYIEDCKRFYRNKVKYVAERLRQLDIAMPDPGYQVEGTFYILVDCHALLGLPLPLEAQKILDEKMVTNDWGIAFYLLFEKGIALAPMSCFGIEPRLGYLRMTCCDQFANMNTLLQRLGQAVTCAREQPRRMELASQLIVDGNIAR